jgi:type VI secretion system protein ImpK
MKNRDATQSNTQNQHQIIAKQNQPTKPNKKHETQTPPSNNLLIDLASKLFATITQIKQKKQFKDSSNLRRYLLKELQNFQLKAERLGYNSDNILIASYVLSVSLDETISKTIWGKKTNWDKQTLLGEMQLNDLTDDRFFVILERICQSPEQYIDIIELIYICLSLGYEGKFQNHPAKTQEIQQIIDYVYQTIKSIRGDFDKQLSPSISKKTKKQIARKKPMPIWLIFLFTVLIIASIYGGLNYLLKICSAQITQQLQNITKVSAK